MIIEVAILFVLALMPRLYGVGLFLTADEKNSIGRSFEFVKAWRHLDINNTFQTTHPGITTLWVGGLSVYAAMPVFKTVFNFGDIYKFIVFARYPMVIINSFLIVVMYLVLRRLFPKKIAFATCAVIALDPFVIGYSKLLHVDAFLMGFLFIAALLLMLYRKKHSRKTYYLSALFSALAIVTKIPAIIILLFAFVVFFVGARKSGMKAMLWTFGKWLAIVIVIVLLLWPSLWWIAGHDNPLDNANQVRKDMAVAALLPHDMDEPYSLAFWHYPATFITRTTLPVMLGVLLLAALLLFKQSRIYVTKHVGKRNIFLLALFGLMFFAEMTVGAKKGDRYVLPVFPVIDFLGVVGIFAALGFAIRQPVKMRLEKYLPFAVLLVPLIVTNYRLGPYELAHYNPLFPYNLSQELGWGEGLDQVAKYLDAQPGKATVASWYPEELRALTKKNVLHINAHAQTKIGYVVLYRNMFGRSPDHWANDFIDEYYKKRKPDFVAHVNGLEYAWVYKQPVVNGIVGEILPGDAVVLQVPMVADNLSRVNVMAATYSGKVKEGRMVLHIRTTVDGADLRTVSMNNSDLQDGGYTKFVFEPIPNVKGMDLFYIFTTEGTKKDNAPTLRVANDEKDYHYSFVKKSALTVDNVRKGERNGWVGIDWYFRVGDKEISRIEVR